MSEIGKIGSIWLKFCLDWLTILTNFVIIDELYDLIWKQLGIDEFADI